MRKILEEGERSKVFRKGISEEAALLIVGAVEGIGLQYVIDPKRFKPKESVDLIRILLESILKR